MLNKVTPAFRLALLAASALTMAPLLAADPPTTPAAGAAISMEAAFFDPPNSARPRVWWHWMNGNITKDGIAKDLAWMKRVGIGGLQNFDANLQTPQIVEKRLIYMDAGWKDAFKFTANEADRLGLELAIAASPGWSETGGPWVKPEDGLKKLVWSETLVPGGKPLTGPLAAPPNVTGPFMTSTGGASIEEMLTGATNKEEKPKFYGDVAVLAYPVAAGAELPAPSFATTDGKPVDAAKLTDADISTFSAIAPIAGSANALTMTYPKPVTVRSASLYAPGGAAMFLGAIAEPVLEVSEDGTTWRKVADMPLMPVPTTISFAPVTASKFRVVMNPRVMSIAGGMGTAAEGVDPGPYGFLRGGMPTIPVRLGDVRLFGDARVDRFEAKAGFEIESDYYHLSKGLAEATGIATGSVVNLTGKMRPDGTLDWTPPKLPKGQLWKVQRLGYSLLGTTNHPAPPEATGLEVDKFDGPAVRRYLEHYIAMYRDASGGLIGAKGVQAILTDSIEVGAANWTPRMVEQFQRLRGYDPTPWLPALTGTIVGSRTESDKFLYDYRRTLADLMSSEHYGTVATVAHEHGLKVYGEALENGRPSLGDDMSMRRHADIPMSAMWTHTREDGPRWAHVADMKGAASVSHVWGQNLVAAESMTSAMNPWNHAPSSLKRIIDLEFVNGVNRPVIHTSVHQPSDAKVPGLTLFIFGQYFNRHDAWAEMAKPWVDYLARNSYMLQQGRNVADVAYFYGEEAPLTALYVDKPVPDAPKGYAYDFLNAEALMTALANDGAELTTPGGARYKAIYLGGTSRMMTLATLRKLAALVEGGATVIGSKPQGDPGLVTDAAEYAALTAKLWPGGADNRVGKGRVVVSDDVDAAMAGIGIVPDFTYSGAGEGAKLPFVHRALSDGDAWFVVNQLGRDESFEARFRVTGKAPELWRAETGKAEPVSYRIENGVTIVPMTLASDESVHVVFRKSATAASLTIKPSAPVELARLDGPWGVAFQAGRGAPASGTLSQLASLSENADPGIKYFSGIATYTRDLAAPRGWKPGQPLWLDLGRVGELAEVKVNGQLVGAVWHAPFRVDVGAAMRKGTNKIEIRVANLWVNRLIGDAQPGAQKIAWTPTPAYQASATLRPSGLIGPVTLWAEKR